MLRSNKPKPKVNKARTNMISFDELNNDNNDDDEYDRSNSNSNHLPRINKKRYNTQSRT